MRDITPVHMTRFDVNAQPWDRIVSCYSDTPWKRPMLDLVNRINSSPLRENLFAITSMHRLLIAQTSTFDYSGPQTLKIDLDPKSQSLTFAVDKYKKVVSVLHGFETLEFILTKRRKWIGTTNPGRSELHL
jgi:hypothetical protein